MAAIVVGADMLTIPVPQQALINVCRIMGIPCQCAFESIRWTYHCRSLCQRQDGNHFCIHSESLRLG